jgi:hypothetical protein
MNKKIPNEKKKEIKFNSVDKILCTQESEEKVINEVNNITDRDLSKTDRSFIETSVILLQKNNI